ncbi:MAG: radical SAM protein [Candidatus Woesearchaeota archaeon]
MRVKLIVAPQTNPDPYWKPLPPLGVATITSYLRSKGYDVSQDDLDIRTIVADRTVSAPGQKINLSVFREQDRVKEYLLGSSVDPYLESTVNRLLSWTDYKGYDVVAISMGIRSHQLMPAMCIAKKIKEETGAAIVVGGRRIYPEILKDYQFVDFGMLADTGENFEKLLGFLSGSSVKKWDIPFLIYRDGGEIKINPPDSLDMDSISHPDYDGLPLDLYKYKPHTEFPGLREADVLILPYHAIEGCVGKCAFCSGHAGKLRNKSPKKIGDDIGKIKKKLGTANFMFMSNEINISYDFMENFAKSLIPHKILWTDSARLDVFDKELMRLTAESGCIQLTYGLESGSQRLLDKMCKGVDLKKAADILKHGYKFGIWSHVNVIAGLPFETDEDIKETIGFLNENAQYINSLTVTKFYVAYNSPIENNPEKFGLVLRKETQERFSNVVLDSFIFDEIDGLKWEEKKLQQEKSVEMIDKGYKKKARAVVPIPSLFYLYSVLGRDMQKIEETVDKCKMLKSYGMYG